MAKGPKPAELMLNEEEQTRLEALVQMPCRVLCTDGEGNEQREQVGPLRFRLTHSSTRKE